MADTSRNRIILLASGVLFALLGITLAIGGVRLVTLGGSWYYLIAGLTLVVSGVLIGRRMALGVWIYVGLFAFTLIWRLAAISGHGFHVSSAH